MPKAFLWFTGLLALSLIIVLLYVVSTGTTTTSSVIRFEKALRCEEKPSFVHLNNTGITTILDQPPAMPENCWRSVALPESTPAQALKVDYKEPGLRRIWYRIIFEIPEQWPEHMPVMVYVPRIFANAWQLRVNNHAIADNRLEWRSTWIRPVGVDVFRGNPKSERNLVVDLGIIASGFEGYSLARISIGDYTSIHSLKTMREYLQVIVPQAEGISTLMMGFFFYLVWQVRRSETEFLLLAFASFSLSIFFSRYSIIFQPEDARLDAWYNALITDLPMPWFSWLTYLFSARYGGFTFPFVERMLWLNVVILSLITISPLSLDYDLSILKAICNTLISIVSLGVVLWQAISRQNKGLRVIAVVTVLTLIPCFSDIALVLNYSDPENYLIGPFSLYFIFASYLYAIQLRYAEAMTTQEHLNLDLAHQLREKELLTHQLSLNESELRTHHDRLLELERVQALAQERQRLMHDMHDGLGSSLLTTLAAVEKKYLPQEEVAEALRNCIEDLRLVIDSLEPTVQDVNSLLATIRYRLGQRIASADLKLDWQIHDLPPLPWLEPPDALNLLRLVQEALVNVLKHANATRILVATSFLGQYVEILIQDNGCGFDAATMRPGRGTPSQIKRAERLGGQLKIESKPGQGTSLHLLLPLNK